MPEFADKEDNDIYTELIKEVTKLGSIKCVDIMSKRKYLILFVQSISFY